MENEMEMKMKMKMKMKTENEWNERNESQYNDGGRRHDQDCD